MRTSIEFVVLLLQIIKHNGNTNYLIMQGYSYSQIISSVEKLTIKGFVRQTEDKITLTNKGEEYLQELNKKLKRKGLYRFISPLTNNKTKKMSTTEIYIPLSHIKE